MMFLCLVLFSSLKIATAGDQKERTLPRITDVLAAETFINASEVAILGFFKGEDSHGYKEFLTALSEVEHIPAAQCGEKEVWDVYNITSDTISVFRKADLHQENLRISDAKKLDSVGLSRFFSMNELYYLTEYDQLTAVGLINSHVKAHLLLFVNKGGDNFLELKNQIRGLAPEFTGQLLFVLVNGVLKVNERTLQYFSLKSVDLPRVALYDGDTDKQWLLPEGEITVERVQHFCQSYLRGELEGQKKDATPNLKSEL